MHRSIAALHLLVLPLTAAAQAPAQERLVQSGDTVCLMGGALAERLQHGGWLEVEYHKRMGGAPVRFRNLGYGADQLDIHQRIENFGKFASDGMALGLGNERFVPWDRYLDHCDADVILACFGYNESFAGLEGLEAFQGRLESFCDHLLAQRYNDEDAPRLVLVSSIPQEKTGDPNLPDGRAHNASIEAYNGVLQAVARAKGVAYLDVYEPLARAYALHAEPLTINGIHLTDRGNRVLGRVLAQALAGGALPLERAREAELVEAVQHKNLLWFNRYRASDGYNVYGGRSRQVYTASDSGEKFPNFDVLQRELDYLDVECANYDELIWALARGEERAVRTDNLPDLIQVETNKKGPGPGGSHPYLDAEAAIEEMTVAPGMKVNLFADERRFPNLDNPVQMAWDPAGRLWVLAWPSYPRWTVGQPMNDKVLVYEDTDGDGRADKETVFADDLRNPTGIEFWNGGVFVACCPDLLFLKDTDGDGRADQREIVLHSISSGDTHHSANSFVLGPDGALYFQEGTFHQSQIESIYGPVYNRDGCVWRYDPRTQRVERYIPYGYANPHGHVFDEFGQDFMTDGTGNVNYYSLPFSGHLEHPDKHRGYFAFFRQRSRPCAATEMLFSRHFPEENWGAYLVANVIGFRGIFQYRMVDDGSGFGAEELDPIVSSTDLNFRPSDIEVGPDGAIYFLDWHNAIIGHLQHHIRDPSRDREHGRVYRVTYEGRPLLERPQIAGAPTVQVVAQLGAPEYRTRYAARIELSARDSGEVLAAAKAWARGLDASSPDHGRSLLEVLWLHQQHNRMDRELLVGLLRHEDHRVRAAATRVVRHGRHLISDALDLLGSMAGDVHPRVRLEAVVAASFFQEGKAADVALESLRHPRDKFLDYALVETMRALEPHWKAAIRRGEVVANGNPAGLAYILDRVGPEELEGLPRVPTVLEALLSRQGVDLASRRDAAISLASQRGTTAVTEVLAAIQRMDAGHGGHAGHVLHDLGMLLNESIGTQAAPRRAALIELATEGTRRATRELGYAAWVATDGDADAAWSHASQSVRGLEVFLGAVPRIRSAEVRASLEARIRPLMFSLPRDLESQVNEAGRGSGLELAYFQPPPKDARLETLQGMTPSSVHEAQRFDLSTPKDRPDAFGLLFTGTVFIPEPGEYTFYTNSDDGSRLYIGGEQVVDNDGAHGMVEKGGRVNLAAGAHPIAVTYYDQSGGEGLSVSWQGPGIDKQPIPAEALGRDPGLALRTQAILAMAKVPGDPRSRLRDVARFLGDGNLLDPAMELLRSVPASANDPDLLRAVVDALSGHVSSLSTDGRTSANVLAAL
ncbi:MAG: PA14 domain-containing protein, partial [Planctomycetota bacterium]|nr:PA14 domain-containing protein [Planctomycetota bacterium]